MRWLIPARVAAKVFVTVEAETEREAVQKFKDNDWIEQTDYDVIKVVKTGRPTLTATPKPPRSKKKKPPPKFEFGSRVRYKDGRRGTVIDGEHPQGVLLRFDGEFFDTIMLEGDLSAVKPEHESEPDIH